MDKQDIIRMLKQYRGLHLEALRLRQRILDKRNSLYDIQAVAINGANVRSGEIADRVERVIEMLNSEIDYYTRKMEEAETAERRIAEMIGGIGDSEERGVLFMHYVEGMTFLEIGEGMHLSERSIWYRHKCAIDRLCGAKNQIAPETGMNISYMRLP